MRKRITVLFVLTLLSSAAAIPAADYVPAYRTTDATLTVVGGGSNIPNDSVCSAPARLFASDHTGNVALWEWRIATRTVDDNAMTTLPTGAPIKTAGAALWTATVVTAVGGHTYEAQVTGGVGQTIDWLFINDDPLCMAGEFTP